MAKFTYQVYERGKPLDRLKVIGDTTQTWYTRYVSGQMLKFFKKQLTFSFETLSARLRELAFLNKKLRINYC